MLLLLAIESGSRDGRLSFSTLEAPVSPHHGPFVDQRAHHFLKEERIAARPFNYLAFQIVGESVYGKHVVDQRLAVGKIQRWDGKLDVMARQPLPD